MGVQVREGVDERRVSALVAVRPDVEAREVDRQVGDRRDVGRRRLPGADVERDAEELAVQGEAPRLAVVAGWKCFLDVAPAGGDQEDVAVVRGQGEAERSPSRPVVAVARVSPRSGPRGAWRR